MAGNVGVLEDEESLGGNRVQPLSSTPVSDHWRHEEEKKKNSTLSERFGLEDFFSLNVWRASIGELLGSTVLVFMIDTIVISTYEMETKASNLIMSALIALTITILLLALAPVSGGHVNPVVSFSAALVGLVSIPRATIYIVAQCVGALLGALALQAVVSSTIEQTFSLGGCTLTVIAPGPHGPVTIGLETGQALWLEIICTFVFLFASIKIVFDGRQAKKLGHVIVCSVIGLMLGLLVFISTTVTATKGYAGAGINPARCLGPAIVRQGHLWNGHWVFWAGPAIGCVAFYLYTKIIPHQHYYHADGYKHDFFNLSKALCV